MVLSTSEAMINNSGMEGQQIYRGYRFPGEMIGHAVWFYHRFALSFRDIEDVPG